MGHDRLLLIFLIQYSSVLPNFEEMVDNKIKEMVGNKMAVTLLFNC